VPSPKTLAQAKRPQKNLATTIREQVSSVGKLDVIILQLFDNTSFYAKTYQGKLIPRRRGVV
jgi:hypothetical protein